MNYGLYVADAFSAELTLVHVMVLPAEQPAVTEAKQKLTSLLPEAFKKKARLRVLHEDITYQPPNCLDARRTT